jgi:hypothetical protein
VTRQDATRICIKNVNLETVHSADFRFLLFKNFYPMKFGLCVETRNLFSAREFSSNFDLFNRNLGGCTQTDRFVCVACGAPIRLARKSRAENEYVWAHIRHAQELCILQSGKTRDFLAPPINLMCDKDSFRLKREFFGNWRKHWAHIKSLISYPDIHKFVHFLHNAERMSLWHNLYLQDYLIPYIFLASSDFPPPAATPRKTWIRFSFSPEIRNINDLLSSAYSDLDFFEFTFKGPRYGTPKATQLINIRKVEISKTFIFDSLAELPVYAETVMNMSFSKIRDRISLRN